MDIIGIKMNKKSARRWTIKKHWPYRKASVLTFDNGSSINWFKWVLFINMIIEHDSV